MRDRLMCVAAPRWRKLWRDALAERGRFVLMLLAVAVSLSAVGAVLGAYAVLTREIAVNYLGTQPAHATLEVRGDVDDAVVARARRDPSVAEAEARDVILARARVGDDWRPLLLFVVDDFARLRLNRFSPEQGEFPPRAGSVLLERTATGMLGASTGGQVQLKTPNGALTAMPVSGLVHDPGLAPAWQERSGYAYVARQTLRQLGEDGTLHELRVRFRGVQESMPAAQAAAEALAQSLRRQGVDVSEVRVPPPSRHPHQRQMTTILFLLLAFSAMALALSGVLVANTLAALLARQVREIGVMKTLGARTGQLAVMYLLLVAAIGLVSLAVAMPLGAGGARGFSSAVATLLNFTLSDAQPPACVWGLQALAGLCVPAAVAAVPVWRACRITVRDAIDRHGVSADRLRPRSTRWPMALRNVARRPSRLALTLALLAAGGAMFMTALNVSQSWERTIAKVYETRHYDVELRLNAAQSLSLRDQLASLPGVRRVEAWGYSEAAFARADRIDVSHAYPDRGHGSFAVMAPPPDTRMISFPLRAGRWLHAGDHDAVVLNHAAIAQQPSLKVGDEVLLSLQGRATRWTLVGIVEEIGAAGVAYVSDEAFARLTDSEGHARLLRVATDASDDQQRMQMIRRLETRLAQAGGHVETAMPLAELRTAMGDHVVILIRALVALAAVMATVGGLGLASSLSISVLERTRELAVMKTLGATPRRLVAMVLSEAQWVGALSSIAAFMLALPLTALLDALVGSLGFVAPLPFVVAWEAVVGWSVLVALVSCAAALPTALRAVRGTVADALVQV
ncbi:MAG TPA: ABC transporter permease [Burkholderiaceae bacterium]|nr:ABC transporter permease [Burkholderiaceae bacterium]